ncbi:hypothetical protein KBC55_03190 [Patescibacteria group bacterium]|nr:hypothetical protein [Patescibacteria group bacterium]
MSDESPILPQGKASISGLIIMLAIAALIPAAFIGGYLLSDYLGQSEPSNVAQDTTPDPIVETPVVQDGKPGKDDEDPKPVPASERIVVDGIGWYPLDEQLLVKQDPENNWLDPIFLTTAGNALVGNWGATYGLGLQTTRLGIVESGEFAGYELREQLIMGYGLGDSPIAGFYTLKNIENEYALEEVYILGSQFIPTGLAGNPGEKKEFFSEIELLEIAKKNVYGWIASAELEIPEAAWGDDDIVVNGNTFYYFTSSTLRGEGADDYSSASNVTYFGDTEDGYKVYRRTDSYPDIQSYQDADMFFVQKKNGTILYYELRLPIFSEEQVSEHILTPQITVNNTPVTDQYTKTMVGGCGFSRYMRQVDRESVPGLYEAGFVTGSPTEKIYLANFADESFDDEFQNWSRQSLESPTREDFINAVPIFYYKDALGRWLQFDSIDIVAPGECGKPVIYLYPEQTTDVSVQLDPQGGFTVTEPAYNTGWNVVAEPSGQLVNKADGLTYPYLFWEGRGGLYSEPEKFWVVAKADVEGFLVEKLGAFGFNAQEIADFNEFWLPRMEAAPWYKIGFHGTNVMDQIAPMNVSPAPDSILRVLMDYSELQEPVAENAPSQIPSFKRNGFTVTEWGGVIR